MAITFPTAWIAGEKIKPSRLNGFMTPISAKFNAGIRSDDLASDAGIKGGQLSSASGQRIVNANLENDAVDNRVLKDDPAAGHATAAVDSDHIRSGAIDSDHYAAGSVNAAALGPAAATLAKHNITTHSSSSIALVGGGGTTTYNTGLPTSTTLPIAVYMINTLTVTGLVLFQNAGVWQLRITSTAGGTLAAGDIKVAYLS